MDRLISVIVYLLPACITLFMVADVYYRTRPRSKYRSAFVLMLCCSFILFGHYLGSLSIDGAFGVVHSYAMLLLSCLSIGLTYRVLALELHPKHMNTRYSHLLQLLYFSPLVLLAISTLSSGFKNTQAQSYDYAYILSSPFRWPGRWEEIGLGYAILTFSILLYAYMYPSSGKQRRIVAILLLGAAGATTFGFAAVPLEQSLPGWDSRTLSLIFWISAVYIVIRNYDYIPGVETRYEILFHASPIGVVLLDRDANIREMNPTAAVMLGWSEGELAGKPFGNLLRNDSRTLFLNRFHLSLRLNGNFPKVECDAFDRSGDKKQFELSGKFLNIEGGKHCLLTMNDVTPLRTAEADVNRLATYDELTGLHNRSFAARQVERMQHEPIALYVLDLDRFKFVNDTLGHQAGNELIRRTALQLRRLADDRTFIARLGGDSFLVAKAMPDGHRSEADELAVNIVQAVNTPFPWGDSETYITTSVGVAMTSEERESGDVLLKHAELAMYQAKELGGNQHAWHAEGKSEELAARLQLANALRRALSRNEFELAYQPQFDTVTGRLVGAEALLRWSSSELGSVSPQIFIPMAEHIGLIEPIGEWVLREACGQMRRWAEHGFDPTIISVNISGRQMESGSFVDTVSRTLAEDRVPPSLIRLEITESAAIRDVASCRLKVAALAGMGISFSLDDFGTGYSSLSLLTELPFRSVKIDKSFVASHTRDNTKTTIVEAIVAMSKRLNVRVVAEGVETADQLDWLRGIGCDFVQGYYTGKPMTAAEFESRFLRRSFHIPSPSVSQTNLFS
ncbi:EAL domain-containing protein [Paenibacillus sp. TRM 82003]|nr:EAL domain-containing protein [Paenibacillus sp. TRM 82003]